MLPLLILFVLLAVFYLGILAGVIGGLYRLKSGREKHRPFVSVVIAARNEAGNIGSCLESMALQDYPADKHEIIVVNDRSEDDTAGIVEAFSEKDSRFRLVTVFAPHPDMAPKKWALHRGIDSARGEIILTTDADCVAGPGWISSMIRYFEDDVALVAGYSPLRHASPSVFHRLVELDALALAGLAAGSMGAGFPLTCSGRNLACRKSVYEEIGGFGSIGRFISGDDDLFLHLIRRRTDWRVRYNVDSESIVSSHPPGTFSEFVHQRIRHASKGRHYPLPLTMGLVAVYLFNLLFLVGIFFPKMWLPVVFLFGLKSFCDFLLVLRTATVFRQRDAISVFPLAMFLHIPYVVIFGWLGQVGKFRWKEDAATSKTLSPSPTE